MGVRQKFFTVLRGSFFFITGLFVFYFNGAFFICYGYLIFFWESERVETFDFIEI